MASPTDHRVNRESIADLRTAPVRRVQILIADALRLHIERISLGTIADMFALSELNLPGQLATDLNTWRARAVREMRDLPEGEAKNGFLGELADVSAADVPASLRQAVEEVFSASPACAIVLSSLRDSWSAAAPSAVKLPGEATLATTGPAKAEEEVVAAPGKAGKAKKATTTTTKAPRAPRAPKTPAAMVDPRRAEYIREDVMDRLSEPDYRERGLKESIVLSGTLHRSPFKDLTSAEILAEMRRLAREGKLKNTGERWRKL